MGIARKSEPIGRGSGSAKRRERRERKDRDLDLLFPKQRAGKHGDHHGPESVATVVPNG